MKRTLSLLALLALISSFTAEAAFIDRIAFLRKQEREARMQEGSSFLSKLPLFSASFWRNPLPLTFSKTGDFDQKLDHFNADDDRTFKQRYWVNSGYAVGEDAPVLYYICGESRCSGAAGFTMGLASELKAHVVTLEHRYYGDSIPTSSYSAQNLRYLSTDEALADLAAFQKHAMIEWNLKGPWISVGGSYPGSLSAYYRLTYPNLVKGALASSAPVEARARFEEYDYQVATVVPPSCLRQIKLAVSAIEKKLQSDATRTSVKTLFQSADVKNDVDFLYVVADMAAASIQYGERENFCRALEASTSTETLVNQYAKVGLRMFSMLGITPIEDTAQGNLSEDVRNYTGTGMRQWYYQSCTEYGYWQVAYHDPKFSSRSARIDLAFHDEICDRMFGIRRSVDTSYINRTYYEPLLDGKGSNILFTNGSDDPWKNLSILPARGNVASSVDAIEIPGAAHCDDLGSMGSSEVRKAQDLFRSLVSDWLR